MIAAHYAVNGAHGLAHRELAIPLAPWQEAFIAAVILAAPAVAFLFVWRGSHSAGGGLLLASLAGALIFGVWYHFVAISPDHVSHLPAAAHSGWRLLFQTTAVLLIPTEALGCWAGLRLMKGRASPDGA
jgi:hypothetical protein